MNTKTKSRSTVNSLMKSCKYLYGAKYQKYTTALVNRLSLLYPKTYTTKIKNLALQDADKGYMAIDCSGFISKVLGIENISSSEMKNTATKIYSVNKASAREGMVLWKSGHVAYIGKDLKIYEAASTAADMRESTFEKRAKDYTNMLVLPGTFLEKEYSGTAIDYDQVVSDVISGKYGNGLKRKANLEAAGFDYAVVQELVNKKLSN